MAKPLPALTADMSERFTREGTALVSKSKAFETEIGDVKQAEFHPQVKIKRFGNEANLSVRLVNDEPAEVRHDERAVVWTTPTKEAKFFDLGGFDEGGGFEFELRLLERPASNVLAFSLQTKGLEFLYQPLLANVEADGSSWEDRGERGRAERPAHVGQSYAVYGRGMSGDYSKVGGQHYGTGKVCHIYRPWAEDAAGTRVWCDLDIDEAAEQLTVTLPQAFVDAAVYPVLVDPTFGFTSIGGTELANSFMVNRWWGMKGAPASSGTVDSISMYSRSLTGSNSIKGAIALASTKALITNGVSNSTTFTGGSTAQWYTMTMPTPPSVTASTDYYVGYVGGGTDAWGSHYMDAGQPANSSLYDSTNNFTTPQDPASGSDEAERVSCYATFTAGAGGRTTKNTRSFPLGIEAGMGFGMGGL